MEPPDLAAAGQPEHLVAAVAANAGETSQTHAAHGPGTAVVSVRTATHKGHTIVIRTLYEIEVDGRPFQPHVVVDNGGRVHYHGLPTRDFASMVGLVEKAIDIFPEDFGPEECDEHGHDHGGHDHGGHDHGTHDHSAHDHGEPPAHEQGHPR